MHEAESIGTTTCHNPNDHTLLGRVRIGEQDAATELYLRYSGRLQAWASSRTSSSLKTRFDPEDVVQSVFRTLFRRVGEGLYDVPPGEELWQLLLVLALGITFGLFLLDVFAYPFGAIILVLAILLRMYSTRSAKR